MGYRVALVLLALLLCSRASAGSRKPMMSADTVLVGSARGMRCCCPCDLWLVRRMGTKRDTLRRWEYTLDRPSVLDSLSARYRWEDR